jgi:hypothetical protein
LHGFTLGELKKANYVTCAAWKGDKLPQGVTFVATGPLAQHATRPTLAAFAVLSSSHVLTVTDHAYAVPKGWKFGGLW